MNFLIKKGNSTLTRNIGVLFIFGQRRLGAIRSKGMLLVVLAAIALLSQSVYAQDQNVGYAAVPPDSIQPGEARPLLWIMSIMDPLAVVHGPGQTNCSAGGNTCYYIPRDITTAYTIPFINNGNGGAGMTVAIVDSYFNSQTEADLAGFNAAFSLPACTIASGWLAIVGQTGGAPPPQPSTITPTIQGWFQEEDLDVQWVHSIAPNAKILLVIANSASTDLYTGVQYAETHAQVVTDSWGSGEFGSETAFDSDFAASGPILFSAGDTYEMLEHPCTSPNVTCVGGTHLLETLTSHRNVDSVWDDAATGNGGTGGGCSVYEFEPAYQVGFSTCGAQRGVPDIAAIADEFTGVLVNLGSNAGGAGCCYVFGGTSLASPVMAAVVANIDAARVAAGKAVLGGNLNQLLYGAAVNPFYHYRFYDVTTGTGATSGWDKTTGLGVTLNPALAAYLVSLP